MSTHKNIKSIDTNLLEHPAVQAWSELRSQHLTPNSITILRQTSKSQVYRIEEAGSVNSTIIAKRCYKTPGLKERTIYEEILPLLPFPTLHYYGFVEEPESKFCWLFIEDAGAEKYLSFIEEHNNYAARFLSLMHLSASHLTKVSELPDRGPKYYLEQLIRARDRILVSLSNPALNADDMTNLKTLVSHLDQLNSNWSKLEVVCKGIPRTLVHGDFKGKNLRVRRIKDSIAILVFDWENAGFGYPARDLVKFRQKNKYGLGWEGFHRSFSSGQAITTYWNEVREHWPKLDLQGIKQLAIIGTIFWCIDCVYWIGSLLEYEWVEKAVTHIRHYDSIIEGSAREIGLMD